MPRLPVRRRGRSRSGGACRARARCDGLLRDHHRRHHRHRHAGRTRGVIEAVAEHIPVSRLAGHFHDTYGQALANIYAALECGVATFDSSVAGLGGCPYAKGATGNVATEDVLYLLDGLGIETGVDMDKLIAAGDYICRQLGKPTNSRVARALAARTGGIAVVGSSVPPPRPLRSLTLSPRTGRGPSGLLVTGNSRPLLRFFTPIGHPDAVTHPRPPQAHPHPRHRVQGLRARRRPVGHRSAPGRHQDLRPLAPPRRTPSASPASRCTTCGCGSPSIST